MFSDIKNIADELESDEQRRMFNELRRRFPNKASRLPAIHDMTS